MRKLQLSRPVSHDWYIFHFGAVSTMVGDDCTMFNSKFENFMDIVPFSVSSLSDILSYCQQDNFHDSLDVMSIFPNFFLLISQTHGLCDRDLFRYIPLVVTPCNTGELVALGIHVFQLHHLFCVLFSSSKSIFSKDVICITIRW